MKFVRVANIEKMEMDSINNFYYLFKESRTLASDRVNNPLRITTSSIVVAQQLNRLAQEIGAKASNGIMKMQYALEDLAKEYPDQGSRDQAVEQVFRSQGWPAIIVSRYYDIAQNIALKLGRGLPDPKEAGLDALNDWATSENDGFKNALTALKNWVPGSAPLEAYLLKGLQLHIWTMVNRERQRARGNISLDTNSSGDDGSTFQDTVPDDNELGRPDAIINGNEIQRKADYFLSLAENFATKQAKLMESSDAIEASQAKGRLSLLQKKVVPELNRIREIGDDVESALEAVRRPGNKHIDEDKEYLAQLQNEYKSIVSRLSTVLTGGKTLTDLSGTDSMTPGARKQMLDKEVATQSGAFEKNVRGEQIEDEHSGLLPYFYNAAHIPSKPGLNSDTSKLYKPNKILFEGIETPAEMGLASSSDPKEYSQLSDQGLFHSLLLKGLLYAKGQHIFERKNQLGNSKNAAQWLQQYFEDKIDSVPELTPRRDSLMSSLNNFLYQESANGKKISNKFEGVWGFLDYYTRAAAYEKARKELFDNKPWNEFTPEDSQKISEAVWKQLYGHGGRQFYLSKPGAYPDMPLNTDTDPKEYLPLVSSEIGNISSGNKNWWAQMTPELQERLKRAKKHHGFKPKDVGLANPMPEGEVLPPDEDENPDIKLSSNQTMFLIRLANLSDDCGDFDTADSIMEMVEIING